MILDPFILLILSGVAITLIIVIGPPLVYMMQALSDAFEDRVANYTSLWWWQSLWSRQQRHDRQARQAFSRWFAGRFAAGGSQQVSENDLLAAQKLSPVIRQLLEEELPTAVRRCNKLHYRMAILTSATHMREIAVEPECLALRQWMVLLLEEGAKLIDQYPLTLKLDVEELLDAGVAIRKRLLPTCTTCPYIRQTVADAGQHCPSARLIGIDQAC